MCGLCTLLILMADRQHLGCGWLLDLWHCVAVQAQPVVELVGDVDHQPHQPANLHQNGVSHQLQGPAHLLNHRRMNSAGLWQCVSPTARAGNPI